MNQKGEQALPRRIIALLKETPGELVQYCRLWRDCWGDGPYDPKMCSNTIYTNVCLARRLLKSGRIKAKSGHGYAFFPD